MLQPGLSELLAGVLSDHQLELDDLEVAAAGRRRVVRVIVDGDGASGRGPDLDEIAAATKAISQALDDSDALGEAPYTLEVSSRGVSRPLTRPAHYRRNIGRLLAISLSSGEQLTGRITAADDQTLTLDIDGRSQTYRLDEIGKAVVQVEMNRRDEAAADGDSEEE